MEYDIRLALVILLIGAFMLAAIVLLHRPEGKKKREHASRRVAHRIEPELSGQDAPAVEATDSLESAAAPCEENVRQPALLPDDEATHDSTTQPRQKPVFSTVGTDAENRIVTLYIRGREGRHVTGVAVLDAALKAGLQFGEMNIFHRRHEGGTRSVFSMANLVNPGSFDPAAWNLFESPGLTLFMALPGPVSALDGWDAMLATGQRLAELLNAELLDDTQSQLSRQRIAQMRDEMREYDRRFGLQ